MVVLEIGVGLIVFTSVFVGDMMLIGASSFWLKGMLGVSIVLIVVIMLLTLLMLV